MQSGHRAGARAAASRAYGRRGRARRPAGLVLPDACIDVIWDGSSIFVAGPDTGPVPVPPHPGQCFAGLRFLPGKAPAYLGVPASELLDSRVPLGDLWGEAAAARLADRLSAAPSPEDAAGYPRPGDC